MRDSDFRGVKLAGESKDVLKTLESLEGQEEGKITKRAAMLGLDAQSLGRLIAAVKSVALLNDSERVEVKRVIDNGRILWQAKLAPKGRLNFSGLSR